MQCTINRSFAREDREPEKMCQRAPRLRAERMTMIKSFEDLQQVGKENVDNALKSFGALSKVSQAIDVVQVD